MDKLSDGKKSCFGFIFLGIAIFISVLTIFSGGIGLIISSFGGDSWLSLRSGTILAVGIFSFFFVISIYWFIKIKNYAWLPMIFSTLYAVLPDIILGPEDDIGALVLGIFLSGAMSWRQNRKAKLLIE
ncbi:MAG: hypothetical protein HON98_02800 [Chloroflexi bacterium]|jgi:hypothetical protein|nr:hypothetical protein [Chloroflexota bacterium]MBT3668772.1 hypothetical protein [Chloroflexota bacterium]MBT4003235.1 hypothetical protein [Chloroflexota bacterium]MBT4305473.1 hypothetical protein [Chloroflexota bacterium]MBT4533084.1 hypothetical protein [Chloroflexota bacterium]